MSTDDYAKRPNETEEQWKARVTGDARKAFDRRRMDQESDMSRDLKYDMNTLKRQIVEMVNDVAEKYDDTGLDVPAYAKEVYEVRFSYLKEKTPTIFNNILNKIFPQPEELRIMLEFHKKILTGELTKFQASQAYSEYKLKKILGKKNNVEHIKNDDVFDLTRTRNSWADEKIYASDDSGSED